MARKRQEKARSAGNDLRGKAERLIQPDEIGDSASMSPPEVDSLLHELRTHQLELEMQNEELRGAQEELTEARDRYADLYDSAPVGYVTSSEKGVILDVNRTATLVLGIDRGRLLGQHLSAFVVPEDQDVYFRHRRMLISQKRGQFCELRTIRARRDPFWIGMESVVVEKKGEENRQVRSVLSDITDRKRIEKEQRDLQRQLHHKQKLESLGLMAGGIAHDFNNLLMAILGNAHQAADHAPAESSQKERLDEIIEITRRAADLTRQMLDYSGKSVIERTPLSLNGIIRQVTRLAESSVSKKALLAFDLRPDLPAVEADASQISQIMLNLIVNASDAIGDDAGRINVSTDISPKGRSWLEPHDDERIVSDGDYVCVAVTDTGCGMDQEVRDKLFDPFFTTKERGRGLGLASVLGIVQGHDGLIKVASEPDRGTTFTILLPASSRPAQPERAAVETAAAVPVIRSGTILVADDDDRVLQLMIRLLEKAGFTVLSAKNGRDAVSAFRKHAGEIDAVLLDLTMPELNGIEAMKEIRRDGAGVPVMIASGYPEENLNSQFGEDRPTRFLPKPLPPGELVRIVQAVLAEAATTR